MKTKGAMTMPTLEGNVPYETMLAAAAERLAGKDVAAAAVRAGMEYDERTGTISFESFGRPAKIFLPDLTAEGELSVWQHIAFLQYLELEAPPKPSGDWIAIGDLEPGAVSRGRSFDTRVAGFVSTRLGRFPEETVRRACAALGAEFEKYKNADLSAVFRFLPEYPFLLNLWFADEEFPASGKILVDAGSGPALCLEAAGTMAELLADRLCSACERE
jgi:hypothetical protein